MNRELSDAAEAVLREAEPNRPEVAGGDERATAANVARLEGMLAQEKAEYDNASRQLDKALEELKAERRRGDAARAEVERLLVDRVRGRR